MTAFLQFLAANRAGVLILLVLLLAVGAFVQWIAWMFGWGRFGGKPAATIGGGKALRFVFADLLVKIIDDFRHLLALVIVLIFALALTYALGLVWHDGGNRVEGMSKALQAVTSSLGGLIGAIIGYYFGEKAGEKGALAIAAAAANTPAAPAPGTPPVQPPPAPPVQQAPAPPAPPAQPAPPPGGN